MIQRSDLPEYIPPQNLEMEQAVLGSMLIEAVAIETVQGILHIGDFYREAHQCIYEAMMNLVKRHENIDLLTLQEQLRTAGVLEQIGGTSYLVQLMNSVSAAANVQYYAKIVAEKAELRRLDTAARKINLLANGDYEDIETLRGQVHQAYMDATEMRGTSELAPMVKVVDDVFFQLEARSEQDSPIVGMKTGSEGLDFFTKGIRDEDLIIVAGRPGMGKSAFAMQIALHCGIQYGSIAIFSLEMSQSQLVERMIANRSGVNLTHIQSGQMQPEEWRRTGQICAELGQTARLFFDDGAYLNLSTMRRKLRRLQAQKGLELVVLDYLQLMESEGTKRGENRAQEIATITRGLKGIAKEFKVPVIALSQLSRAVESRPNKRPMMVDLRESGAIEQDADIIMFLYSDDYYLRGQGKNAASEGYDRTEVSFAKFRNGPGGKILRMRFTGSLMRFEDETGEQERTPLNDYPQHNEPEDKPEPPMRGWNQSYNDE